MTRGWLVDATSSCRQEDEPPPILLRATLSQYSKAHFDMMWPDAFAPLLVFLSIANTHPDQLTLAEFSALRTRRLVQNLDMMAIARTVELTAKANEGKAEDETDDEDNARKVKSRIESEFMGGEHDIEEDEPFDEEGPKKAFYRITIETATSLLRRDDEIEAANKKGRHREVDMQMKAFADKFGANLAATLPSISQQHVDADPRFLGTDKRQAVAALAHQRAVRNDMKKEQEDLRSSVDTPDKEGELEARLAALENLHFEEARATCVTIPLPEILKGPKHVAETIMVEQRKHDRALNDEQLLLFALWVFILQEAFVRRPNPEEPYLALDTDLCDILVDGGGGCGKTMLINHFLVPLLQCFFGRAGVVKAAPSNKAARGIGAKTMHSLLGFTPDISLRTSALALTTQKRVKLERTFLPAGAMLHDESSMLAGALNHAGSLLATYARESKFRLRREDYALPGQRYGRIPFLGYFGDHLQLPPVPKANSMLASLEHTSQEHRVGAAIFRQVRYVFQLKQMMRFTDPILIRILHTMRTVGGLPLSESDWQALQATEIDNNISSAEKPDVTGWYHTCYVWSVISMAAFLEARESARKAQKILFYVQAVDMPMNLATQSGPESQKLYHAFLQVSSLTKTKRLPGFCLLHVGMEARLTTTLEMPYAVQDATATVLEIEFDRPDEHHRQHTTGSAVLESLEPEALLNSLPVAVLIKLHDCKHVFLPVQPCANCPVFVKTCTACMANRDAIEGVFAVEPLSRTWKYDGSELGGQFINVKRRQIPLAPARVLPLYSMQGMTATPGLVAHWVIPPRLPSDIKWLICYVTLSRVPSLKQLLSTGLSSKIREILENGPPEGMVQMFDTLFEQKMQDTQSAALQAKQRLGW